MARIRTIKPEFWVDDQIVELDYVSRLLFIGLWNFVDDDGYIEYKPKRIKMQVFPADDLDVSGALRSLLDANRLVVCDSDQGPLLRIINWQRHQVISHPTATKFTNVVPRTSGSEGITPEDSGAVEKSPERSVLKGKERKGKELSSSSDDDGFDEFWSLYPRKIGKGAARKAFTSALKRSTSSAIIDGVRRYVSHVQGTDPKFIAHPTSWLNADRWDDQYAPTVTAPVDWMNR